MLRRRATRHVIVTILAVFVGLAGIAQAAHVHKAASSQADTQCLLCAHAERSAGPPVVPPAPRFQIAWFVLAASPAAQTYANAFFVRFRARAPPTV